MAPASVGRQPLRSSLSLHGGYRFDVNRCNHSPGSKYFGIGLHAILLPRERLLATWSRL